MPVHEDTAHGVALRVLSLALGVFFLFMALDKRAWLGQPDLLATQLTGWLVNAPTPSRWYLETVAIPGARIFAPLVLAGEFAVALALLLGVYVRPAAAAGFFMVVNFHVAMGVMLSWTYLWNGYGPPVLGGLLALAIGGGNLPFSLRRARP
jgi:uncharacterized membrane protein YphA (DoxX/SURF4 family)